MKKRIAAIATAALSLFSMTSVVATAADTAKPSYDFVVFGDSIASGYGRIENTKYTYGDILADYYNGTVNNYAVAGDKSEDMLNLIKSLDADQKKAVSDAEYVLISIGGNDIIRFALNYLVNFCAENKLLADGVTPESIPADMDIAEYLNVFDIEKIQEFALGDLSNSLAVLTALTESTSQVYINNSTYHGIIQNSIIPNINEAVAAIKAVNPKAEVIVQNIYQPLQLSPAFIKSALGSSTIYTQVVNSLRSQLEKIMGAFNNELTAAANDNGFKVADVLTEFTALGDTAPSNTAPGNASYFVDVQQDRSKLDYHPNQKGHLAIAAEIIETIGETHKDLGLLSDVYDELSDKSSYPAASLKTFEAAAGSIMLGDVNVDDMIDARDASAVLTEYANTSAKQPAQLKSRQYKVGKVTNDDILDARDASLILSFYAQASAGGTSDINEFIAAQK